MEKRGQQEIAGFVIIVVLVMVAVFIFVIMYFANKKDNLQNKEVEVLLLSMVKITTDCFLEEGKPANLREVLINAYGEIPKKCKGNEKNSREYAEEYIPKIMKDILALETNFEVYSLEIIDEKSGTIVKSFSNGDCQKKGVIRSADLIIKSEELRAFLKIC
ncbi:MAG: hypothetical protein QXX68_00480 [Candidatus Pacearchaeota archaeon]